MDTPSADSGSDSIGGLSGGINAGYLWGGDSIQYGIEAGYYMYPENKYELNGLQLNYEGKHGDLMGIGRYKFDSGWIVISKFGLAFVKQVTSGNSSVNYSKQQTLPKITLGVGYELTNNWELNTQLSHVFGSKPTAFPNPGTSDDYNQVASIDMMALGISYNF